jgi:glycosyltransferase involved in cell wall biosynthesis
LTDTPLVSICVPTYNGERHLRQALESALEQDHPNFEIVVSDACSHDATLDIVKSFGTSKIRTFHVGPERSVADNWNNSVQMSNGALVKLLCQDDVLERSCLSRQAELLENSPEASFCRSNRRLITDSGRVIRLPFTNQSSFPSTSFGTGASFIVRTGSNPFGEPCAVMFRRSTFNLVGGFRGSYLIDLDMWLRLWTLGPFIDDQEEVASFRLSRVSWSRKIGRSQSQEWLSAITAFSQECPGAFHTSDLRRGYRLAKLKSLVRNVVATSASFL